MASQRRPLVVVEDHLGHIDQLLELLRESGPELLERLAVVCLERPGPDTQAAVASWRRRHPEVRFIADTELPADIFERGSCYPKLINELLAPRGLLLQDIQLETLRFLPADQWWESIYLANTIRGMFASRPPQVLFMSNKQGFHATFGGELAEVGFDPRDVLNKDRLAETLVRTLRHKLHAAFPLELELHDDDRWLTTDIEEHEQLCAEMDLILWEDRAATLALGGRSVDALRIELAGDEAQTWRELVNAQLDGRPGVPTAELGERIAPELADRAERSNKAAKHIFALRRRLLDRELLQTVDHHYRLARELAVGHVRRRARA